jgi:hypothetical protein
MMSVAIKSRVRIASANGDDSRVLYIRDLVCH